MDNEVEANFLFLYDVILQHINVILRWEVSHCKKIRNSKGVG